MTTVAHPSVRAPARPRLGRLLKYAFLVWRSGRFDAAFYRSQCPGERAARWFPILHYLARGAQAGLDPSPRFDTSYYLEQNPEVAASGKDALVHFLRRGLPEHRAPMARAEIVPGMRLTRALRAGLERAGDFADAGRARRILVVDQRVPTPDRDSASVRMFAILALLRRLGHEVTFVGDAPRPPRRARRAVEALGVQVISGPAAAARHLAAHGHAYGDAVLSSPQAAERYLMTVRAYALRARVVYDTVDLHWVRLERCGAVTGDATAGAQAARFRRLEGIGATCADLTLTVTEADREALLAAVPGAKVEVLPNVHAVRGTTRPFGGRAGLMFIGAFSHTPNVDGVAWFVEQVLPLVHARLPGLVLRLVGGDVPERVKRLASATVQVLGYVPSVEPIFDASRVFVSPLRYGAGMKGKIGQSLAHGLPVVTTSVGAEGMALVDGENALVADDPAAFADAVVRLAGDEALWTRLSGAGLRHVADRFSEERALERLAALFGAPATEAGGASGAPAAGARELP